MSLAGPAAGAEFILSDDKLSFSSTVSQPEGASKVHEQNVPGEQLQNGEETYDTKFPYPDGGIIGDDGFVDGLPARTHPRPNAVRDGGGAAGWFEPGGGFGATFPGAGG